jgi:DNA-binding IclR family transcriptional regulator
MQAERRVLLDQGESAQELRWVFSNSLVPMPLHAGAAKMLLALLPDADVQRIVKRDDLVSYTHRQPGGTDARSPADPCTGLLGFDEEVSPGIVSPGGAVDDAFCGTALGGHEP